MADELDFLESYRFLLAAKHLNSVIFDISIGPQIRNFSRIPPGALQLLVENAVKHTVFSVNHPLRIRIYDDRNYLYVENNLSQRKAHSTGPDTGMEAGLRPFAEAGPGHFEKTGLRHLQKRYELTGGTGIKVSEETGSFIVRLPVF